jgi:hypothetical protein
MTTTQNLTNKTTGELQVGDIVRCHGMRVRINSIKRHEDPNTYEGQFWSTDGSVLNLDEVRAAGIVPMGWLETETYVEGQGWVTDRNDYWNVQGNNLATWAVEVPEPGETSRLNDRCNADRENCSGVVSCTTHTEPRLTTLSDLEHVESGTPVTFRPWSDSKITMQGWFSGIEKTGAVRLRDRIGAYHYLRASAVVGVGQCDSETPNRYCVLAAGHDGKHADGGAEWA